MQAGRTAECELCEAMCPDAVDGALSEAERRVFEQHVAKCASCARELEAAQHGAAWLGMLKGHAPEPPAALLEKILAGTTGAETAAASPNRLLHDETAQKWGTRSVGDLVPAPAREAAPAWALGPVLRKIAAAFRMEGTRTTLQPRLAMTAAMAFVSIALTLNLTGVRLRNLRASSFTPSAMRRAVVDESASVARSFENMRVVYQVESRVSELRGEGPLAGQADQADQIDEQSPFSAPQDGTASSGTTQPSQPAQSGRAPRHKGL